MVSVRRLSILYLAACFRPAFFFNHDVAMFRIGTKQHKTVTGRAVWSQSEREHGHDPTRNDVLRVNWLVDMNLNRSWQWEPALRYIIACRVVDLTGSVPASRALATNESSSTPCGMPRIYYLLVVQLYSGRPSCASDLMVQLLVKRQWPRASGESDRVTANWHSPNRHQIGTYSTLLEAT
jgi:hypothetical protein